MSEQNIEVKYVFDLDGTLCTNTNGKYHLAEPKINNIQKVNKLFDEGNHITIFTARGMNTFNNDVSMVYSIYFDFTKKQLEDWGVKYHRLILGKPSGDFYIDDKGYNVVDFFV